MQEMEINSHPLVTQMKSSYPKAVATRRSTNPIFILLFLINFALWLGIGVYCLFTEPYINYISKEFLSWITFAPAETISIVFIILLAYLLSGWTNKAVNLTIVCIFIVSITIILFIVMQIYMYYDHVYDIDRSHEEKISFRLFWSFAFIVFTVAFLIYNVAILVHTTKADTNVLAQIINESWRGVPGSHLAFYFSFLIVALSTTVSMFTVSLIYFELTHLLANNPYWSWLRITLFAFGGRCVFNFFWNFGFMVKSDYCTNYYSTLGHQKGTYIFTSIVRVTRYHLGTVSFLSIPFVSSVCALAIAFRMNHQPGKKSTYSGINFCSKFCLFTDISEYALVQTSIYGHHAVKSIIEMFSLQHSDSELFLIANAASHKITQTITILAVLVAWPLQLMIKRISNPDYLSWDSTGIYGYMTIEMPIVFLVIYYVNLMSKFWVRPATCTYLVHKMTSLRDSA